MRAFFFASPPAYSRAMSAAAKLRTSTQPLHDAVDAAFGAYRLDDEASYRRFLAAHARALPAVEAALAGQSTLPPWQARAPLLAADLADLGEPMPPPLDFTLTDAASAWGALYVAEGSRLGGVMLARQVAGHLPSRYLAAAHRPGEWRALRTAIDEAGAAGGDGWPERAAAGAAACFALYARAAALEVSAADPRSAR